MATEQQQHSLKRPHGSPPAAEDGDAKIPGRQRSREACVPCRQRKRKCNGRMPCETCVRYEYQCEYAHAPRANHQFSNRLAQVDTDSPLEGRSPAATSYSDTNNNPAVHPRPLTAPGARFHHRSIIDPTKTRFVRANSAIAFPRILGMEFESDSIPRLHSFAWNLGIRPESEETVVELPKLLSLAEMQHLAGIYFKIVRPEIGLLDEADFMEKAAARFADPSKYADFDAIVLGVAALGSFFAPTPHPGEVDFLVQSRRFLVQWSLNRSPTTNHVAGWALRAIYLRLTSRPHASWVASCIALHTAEACGLHKEMQTIAVVYPAAPQSDHRLARIRRNLFWISRALNTIFSFELGRSKVRFDGVTARKLASDSGSTVHHLVELAEYLPSDLPAHHVDGTPDPPAALSSALTRIEELRADSPFITMLKADMAFAIYRRLWLMSLTDAKDRADTVISIGGAALDAAKIQLDAQIHWWNVVATPFHFLCVLLAIDTPRSIARVNDAMEMLRKVVQKYDTHMVREAYNQAAGLVKMAHSRKSRELEMLSVVADVQLLEDAPSVSMTSSADGMSAAPPPLDWADDVPFLWDVFLNPDLVISQQQQVQNGLAAPYAAGQLQQF